MEGDSQILINMAKHLLNGSQAKKIATRWRLEARLKAMEQELLTNRAITFSHIKRYGNKVADFLVNVGVDNEHIIQIGTLDILTNDAQAQECNRLVQHDAIPPNAGDNLRQL